MKKTLLNFNWSELADNFKRIVNEILFFRRDDDSDSFDNPYVIY